MTEKEKTFESLPLSQVPPAYFDHTQQPRPDHNAGGLVQVTRLDNGAFTNAPAQDDRTARLHNPPTWLLANLLVAKITVFVMFAVGPVLCAFGIVMRDDLTDDEHDWTCEENYIVQASEPWDSGILMPDPGQGRYHSQCRMLYHWSKLLIAAGSLSVFRPMLQAIPVYQPTQWTFKYSPSSTFAKLHSPARAYMLRTFFSAVPAVLYLVCAFMLGTSRFFTGPKAAEEYWIMYIICLALICVSFILSLHQAMSTVSAAWHLRGLKEAPHGFRPAA